MATYRYTGKLSRDGRPELPELIDHADVGVYWTNLGIQLGLEQGDLDCLHQQYFLPVDKLSHMFQMWLDRTPNATRQDVLEALKKIKKFDIAAKYEKFIEPKVAKENTPALQRQMNSDTGGGSEEPDVGQAERSSHQPRVVIPKIEKECVPFAPSLVNGVEVLLMTVTPHETDAVLSYTKPMEGYDHVIETRPNVAGSVHLTIYLGVYGRNKVGIWKTSPGPDDIRDYLPSLLKHIIKARFIISIGFCYGLNKEMSKLKDIIVADEIYDFSEGHIGPHGTDYNYKSKPVGATLKHRFCHQTTGGPKVWLRPIVSSPNVINNPEVRKGIRDQARRALGGEMEGAAIMKAKALVSPEPEAIVIKAIADWGDGNKDATRGIQPEACLAAAKHVHDRMSEATLSISDQNQTSSSSSWQMWMPVLIIVPAAVAVIALLISKK